MTEPRHRKQFDNARTAYDARNALGITNWNYTDGGTGKTQLPTGNLTLKAGPGVTLTVTGSTVIIGMTGGGGGPGAAALQFNHKTNSMYLGWVT